jgi:hypothetical protein
MKVLNLRCANGHGFEGWFASDDDFMSQNGAAWSNARCVPTAHHAHAGRTAPEPVGRA